LIKDFTGINAPYEEPENPELIIDTDKETIEESAEKVLNILKKQNII
jgi:adenylylsulfate kinase